MLQPTPLARVPRKYQVIASVIDVEREGATKASKAECAPKSKPVHSFLQELLAILYEKGPATEGIFRKAASEKARKELKEVLNQGKSADLDSRPVHLLAVVLKVNSLHQQSTQLSEHVPHVHGPLAVPPLPSVALQAKSLLKPDSGLQAQDTVALFFPLRLSAALVLPLIPCMTMGNSLPPPPPQHPPLLREDHGDSGLHQRLS